MYLQTYIYIYIYIYIRHRASGTWWRVVLMLAPLQTSPHQLSQRLWLIPLRQQKYVKKVMSKKCLQTVAKEDRSLPKWSQKWSPKLRNSGPEPDLEKPSGKKPQNINSVHYLLCFKHIQALPKASLFVTVWGPKLVPEPLRKGSPKKLAKRLPFLPKDVRKRTPEGPQSSPRIHQIPTSFGPLLGTRSNKS